MAGRFVSFQNYITKEQECVRMSSNRFLQNKKGAIYLDQKQFMHHCSELRLLIHPRRCKNKTCHSSISNHLLIEGEKTIN